MPIQESYTIHIGTKVTIRIHNTYQTWNIVEKGHSDIRKSNISYDAQLATLLLNHKKGDTVRGRIHDKEVEIEILKVEYIP